MRFMGVDSHSNGLFLRVTLPLAVFGLINQAARTVMAVIGPVLAVEFALSASELGLLAACMLAAYALAQLPGGMALDRLGPRNVQATLGLLTAAGFALFALAESLGTLVLARVIIGVGVSAGLMAIIKANTQWFAPAKVAMVTGHRGVDRRAGQRAVHRRRSRPRCRRSAGAACCGCCARSPRPRRCGFCSRCPTGEEASRISRPSSASWARSCARRVFWRFGPAVAMLSVLNFAYLGLWAGPWLRDVAGYDGQASANTLLAYTLTMMAGALVVGAAASRAKALGLPPMLVTLACTAGQVAAQIGLALQPAAPLVVGGLWMLFAFCVAGATAGYIASARCFRPSRPRAWRPRSTRSRSAARSCCRPPSAGCSISGRAPARAAGIRGAIRPPSRSRSLLQLFIAARLIGGRR